MSSEPIHPLVATHEEVQSKTSLGPGAHGECIANGELSEFTKNATAAISEALFSEDEAPIPKARLEWLLREYADFMSRAPAKGRFLFSMATVVISFFAPILIGKLPPFSKLSFSDRIRALRKLESRPIGKVLIPLRAILCLIYYEHPEAAAIIELPDQTERLVNLRTK